MSSTTITTTVTSPVAIDITQNPKDWQDTISHPKTQQLMSSMIKHVLGNEAAELPKELHPKITNTYSKWSCGMIGSPESIDATPVQRLHNSKLYIPTMINKEKLHGDEHFKRLPVLSSPLNIPTEDPTPKVVKFIDVLKRNPHVQMSFIGKNVQDFALRDVGGGDGSMAMAIAQGLNLTNAPKIYEVATYKDPKCEVINYTQDGSIPEQADSIDLATMNMVLHHIENPDKALGELHRVMKNGAILIMRETDTQGCKGIDGFQHIMDHHWYNSNPHADQVEGVPLKMQFRNTDETRELFAKNGFELLDVETHMRDEDNAFFPKFYILQCVKSVMESNSKSSSSSSSSASSLSSVI